MTAPPQTLAAALAAIRERMARAAERAGRDPATVTLIAVTKTQPHARVAEAVALGVRDFGENRVQEALAKFAAPDHGAPSGAGDGDLIPRAGLTLHLIGTLQRNKARRAAAFFDAIQSVDRIDLAADLERHRTADAPDRPPLPVLIEVNISGEASKSGVLPADLPALAEGLRAARPGLRLHIVGAIGEDPGVQKAMTDYCVAALG